MKLLAQVQLFKRAAFPEYVCRASDTADSVTSSLLSFTLTAYTATVTLDETSTRVCLGRIIHLYIFLYSDSVTFLSSVFVLQKK